MRKIVIVSIKNNPPPNLPAFLPSRPALITASCHKDAPNAPTLLQAQCFIENNLLVIPITWTLSSTNGIDSQQLYRHNQLIQTLAADVNSYTDTAVSEGFEYDYYVIAIKNIPSNDPTDTPSDPSNRVHVGPCTVRPTNVAGTCLGNRFALQMDLFKTLTWTLSTDTNIQSQKLYRNNALINTLLPTQNSYEDHTRPPTPPDTYGISAIDSSGFESGRTKAEVSC